MQDSPKDGINWKLAIGSFLLLILPTWYVFYWISPSHMPANEADPNGPGAGVDNLIIYVHVLMALLFVGWLGYFLYVILRFSKARNPKADYAGVKSHSSTYIEAAVAIFEAVLLIGFAIPVWSHAVDKFPSEKDSTVIKLIAQQFSWNGWYPGPHGVFAKQDRKFISGDNTFGLDKSDPHFKENFFVAKNLLVPVGKPVIVYISSLDVIHCFACKPLRVTQDAIPGMVIPAHFTPMKIAEYQINCAQLCGNGHYSMRGTIKVVSQADYDKWMADKSKAGAGAGGGYE
jgi:cytochrome c oxidase subunit 2